LVSHFVQTEAGLPTPEDLLELLDEQMGAVAKK
jgi:hypothetical protein